MYKRLQQQQLAHLGHDKGLMNEKKTAKKLIKLAKKHPDWYTEKDVYYAKQVKKRIKEEEKLNDD